MLLNTAALFFYPSPKYRRILVVLEGPKAWFMVLTNNLCSSMYTNGDSIRNVTILARVDSETGRTIWAKQFNITLISIPYLNVKYPRIDSNDNIYTVLTYRNMDSFESVLQQKAQYNFDQKNDPVKKWASSINKKCFALKQ